MGFILDSDNSNIKIILSSRESEAVKIAAANLDSDIEKAFGVTKSELNSENILKKNNSDLSSEHSCKENPGKIYISTKESGRWEQFTIECKGNDLYITGVGRRGTIYGIYTLSRMMGISPWYYFADVPVHAPKEIKFNDGDIIKDAPTIQYRGIFINDEEELDKWARFHMDEPTIGVKTYEKIFELILRLKGNYIWPAMHVNSFNMQPECGALADRMGIVVGTSHCDMLMRSNFREWEPWIKKKGYEGAVYDYSFDGKNREILKEYWMESVEQNKDYELSYTLGMRGIHDSGFVTDALKADSNEELMIKKCNLLGQVIKDQAKILKETLKKETLKTFVPYKEVLNLYDRGLDIPEDITLIWSNDNYGYIRRYPSEKEQRRKGGNGVYYHNSYWSPTLRHYLFLSSIPLAKTKYELEKAYENGIKKLWICNMGAIKPLEQEMEFFITLGWDYGKKNAKVNDIKEYLVDWIRGNFAEKDDVFYNQAAELLIDYAQITDVRKVEHMEEDVFSQNSYGNEAALRLNALRSVYTKANKLYDSLEEDEKDAFFELVLMKIHASYYTNAMYYFADRSNLCVERGLNKASREYVSLSKAFEDMRSKMLYYYNKVMANGKWDKIVTPEDFPPPRTSMHPASKASLTINEVEKEDKNELPRGSAHGIEATSGELKNAKIIKYLGRGLGDLVELMQNGSATYSFRIDREMPITLCVFRYPSLNSIKNIEVTVTVDGNLPYKLVSTSNDEWRGSWEENVLNQVDKLYLPLSVLSKGNHTITLSDASKYFAFSRVVLYEGDVLYDNLGAVKIGEGRYFSDSLPDRSYLTECHGVLYGNIETPKRIIPVGTFADGKSVMDSLDDTSYSKSDMELFMPDRDLLSEDLMDFGVSLPSEKKNRIIIEAFSAYNETHVSYTEGSCWDYSTGVSYNRTNQAMYIRKRGLYYNSDNAPSINYRFKALGGRYLLYILMKINSRDASKIEILIDGKHVDTDWENDTLWRYEAEQIFRYVPILTTTLSRGEHLISVKVYSSTIRIERLILLNS